jgi:hypothetical protein
MAPLFCITIGSLLIKFFDGHAEVFGVSRFRKSGKYHLSAFAKPHVSGLMEPHLTCDDPGVPAKAKERIWFRYDHEDLKRFLERFEEAVVCLVLDRQVRVRLDDLENEDWIATFIPDDVADEWFEKHKSAKRVKLSLALMRELFDLGLDHPLPVVALDELVDEAPANPRRRCFSLLRVNANDEIEHAFIGWRPGREGEREWYLTPPGDLIDQETIRQLFVEALPSAFYESLLTINAKLGLGLDRERIVAFLEEARSRERAA